MADGRDDNFNFPAQRGRKLRNQGSNPTGSQTQSFTPYYSDEMDYEEGGVAINKRTRMNEKNYAENRPSSKECQNQGLNLKEPLS